jgi:hypothetical protein
VDDDKIVLGLEIRELQTETTIWIKSYGVMDCGLELMRLAWPGLEHRFSVQRDQEDIPMLETQDPLKLVKGHHCFKPDLLVATPVNLLEIEQGYLTSPSTTFQQSGWENLAETTPTSAQPKVVIESYPHHGMIWARGPMCKARMT